MTPQEAIEAIKLKDIHIESGAIRITAFFQGLSVAKEALEYRTPKKYLLIDGRCICPTCKSNQGYLHQHCNNCGQKILWGDTE